MLEALIAAAGMVLFAVFAHSPPPFLSLRLAGLLATAAAVAHGLRALPSPSTVLGVRRLDRTAAICIIAGALLGAALGALHRLSLGRPALPAALAGFAVPAALIGMTEELLYRGYLQGRARRLGIAGAVAFAALCHTAYKCALFAAPPPGLQIDMPALAAWTLLGGLAFGALRECAGSVFPPLAAHAFFDCIAYGDRTTAPWWVWS